MATDPLPLDHDMLRQALNYMESALDLLDRSDVSAHIGARLDHAICDLQSAIGVPGRQSDQGSIAGRSA